MKTLQYTDLTRAQKRMVERVYRDTFCPNELNGNTRENLIHKGWLEVLDDVVQLTRNGREAYRGWLNIERNQRAQKDSRYANGYRKRYTKATAQRLEVLKRYQQMARRALGLPP